MPRHVETFGRVEKGQLTITDRAKFIDAVGFLPDGLVSVTVKLVGKKHSDGANAYYHGIVCVILAQTISDAWGEIITPDDVHNMCKERFNPRTIETSNGTVTLPGSTADLDTADFWNYIEKVRQWGASFWGVVIPDPDPLLKRKPKTVSA